MEKDTLMIMNDNIKEVLSKRRSYTIFAVFTSTDKRYEDERHVNLDMAVYLALHWRTILCLSMMNTTNFQSSTEQRYSSWCVALRMRIHSLIMYESYAEVMEIDRNSLSPSDSID